MKTTATQHHSIRPAHPTTVSRRVAAATLSAALVLAGLALLIAGLISGGTGRASADARCDAYRAQYGPLWPCIPSDPHTVTPTPYQPTTAPAGPTDGSGVHMGVDVGPGPGPGNGTPIVPVPGSPPAPGQPPTDGKPVAPAPIPSIPATAGAPTQAPQHPAPPTQAPTPPPELQHVHATAPHTAEPATTNDGTSPMTTGLLAAASAGLVVGATWRLRLQRHQAPAIVGGGEPPVPSAAGPAWWGTTPLVRCGPIDPVLSRLLAPGGSERGQLGNSQLVLINDATSPRAYIFDEHVPPGGHIRINPDGSATVLDSNGNPVRQIAKPWAYDAVGRPQKTWYTVDSDGKLVQHVAPDDDALYPILADPQGSDIGANGLDQAQGRPEGSSWQQPIYGPDGKQTGTITNQIPVGNGDQTVDQTFTDMNGNVTSQQRVTSNGEGGYQRWANNSDGSAAYRAQDAPGGDPYGASWDAGTDPGSQAPNSVYGQNWQATQSHTVRDNGDSTQTTVDSNQDPSGQWTHHTQTGDGATWLTTSGPDGENTTTTGQWDKNGSGWVLDANGNRADRYIDGNGNPVVVSTDPATQNKTYLFIRDGQRYSNTFDKYGNVVGTAAYNPDGSLKSGWQQTPDGDITFNADGSRDITNTDNSVKWYKIHLNPDGSGIAYMGNLDVQYFDKNGSIYKTNKAPDTRSGAEKFFSGAGHAAVGFGNTVSHLSTWWALPFDKDVQDTYKDTGTSIWNTTTTLATYLPESMGDAANTATNPTGANPHPNREAQVFQALSGMNPDDIRSHPWESLGAGAVLGIAMLGTHTPEAGPGALPIRPAVEDSIAPVIADHGYSLPRFQQLLTRPSDALDPFERAVIDSARSAIPDIGYHTPMQKAIPPDGPQAHNILNNHFPNPDEYPRNGIGGSVTARPDVQALHTPQDLIDGLALKTDWGHRTDYAYILRYTLRQDSPLPRTPNGPMTNTQLTPGGLHPLEGHTPTTNGIPFGYPFTGTGFTANGSHIIPEYYFEEAGKMNLGAQLIQIGADGTETILRILTDDGWITP